MSEHFNPNALHPVDLIEAEVSRLYRRTMRRAESQDRLLTTAEEYNLTALSAAVSLRRIADALRILAVVALVGIIADVALRIW